MRVRGESEGKDVSGYELPVTFHGCPPEVIPSISQMGFNRSFCGKNMTKVSGEVLV